MAHRKGEDMKEKSFRIVTCIAAAYHILLAATGLLCPVSTVEKVIAIAFGLGVEVGPLLGLVVKFTSVYMLAFGVMLLLLSSNPSKYRVFAMPALLLFGLRFVNRLVFFSTLSTAGITVSRNITGTGLLLFFFAAMLVSLPKKDD